ncbi:hypothetical protein BALOs_1107 [Halobacteriovorax sp. BALOs_7]|uniref:hypothetical protein n=1 Tax=Halobacteriovorax sp. BALOs_7 TaxID=2109558 RepID=UPI000EA3F045|nr:hypothetical protein [Halobacteriovorax sp. BALOs_7]AYF44116.1 hypothetical protein BALOs_1107 [Halobacteriovorax sp. BALOs_7]
MSLNKISIFLFSFILALKSIAGIDSISNQVININGTNYRAKDVISDIVRIARARDPKHVSPRLIPHEYGETPVRNEGTREICIECQDMTNFTSQIVDIVQKFNEDNPRKDNVELSQESFKLQAVLDYTKITDNEGQPRCITNTFASKEAFYRPELFEDFELVFTSEADLSQFSSMTLQSSSNILSHITWFRATDEVGEDIFVKVVNIKDKRPYFQIYYAGESFVDPIAHRKLALPDLTTSEEEIIPRRRELSALENRSYETGLGSVKINRALHLRQDYYIPTSLTLINMETESKPFENTTIRSNLDISDRDQELNIGVDNKLTETIDLKSNLELSPKDQELDMAVEVNGRRRASAHVEADGTYRVGVSMASPRFKNFDFETDISYDSNRNTRIDNNFRLNGSTIIQTGTILAENGDFDFVAGRSIDVFDDAIVTFEVRKNGIAQNATDNDSLNRLADQTSAYIRFDMKF